MNSTSQGSGMIRAPHRGPLRVATDLWRAGGTFRGFAEFAVIGAIVMAFVPGGGASLSDQLRGFLPSMHAPPETPASTKIGAPGAAKDLPVFKDAGAGIAPRVSELKIEHSYFDAVEQPLRGHLKSALTAYYARVPRLVAESLETDDPNERHVLLLRGLALLSLANPEAQASGVALLQQASAAGEARAAAILGVLKMTGMAGFERDGAGGRDLLERAVAAGDAPAARVLGEGFLSGWAGAIDPARAERYFRIASDRGDVKATFRVGEILFAGRGIPKNQAEAERFFLKAANAGYAEAQAMVGALRLMPYSSGLTDDPDEALSWFERAAAQDEPHAMFYLGVFYVEYGERIGRVDPVRAFGLFKRCAELTLNRECVFAYATAYDNGIGTVRDSVMAYALYSLVATRESDAKARGRRDEVGKNLSSEEKVRANFIATDFLKKGDLSHRVDLKFKATQEQLGQGFKGSR